MRTIRIEGEICRATLNSVREAVEGGETSICLTINSLGGDLEAGFAIYRCLRSRPLELRAKVDGYCASAAVLPLLAVPLENREATKTSCFLIHTPLTTAGEVNVRGAERLLDDLRVANSELLNIYGERTTMPRETMDEYMDRQRWFYADAAKAFGFIGEITPMYNEARKTDINTTKRAMNFIQTIIRKLMNETAVVETVDGRQIEVAGPLEVGAVINAEDGVYRLITGETITVQGGVVVDVNVEPEVAADEPKEEPAAEDEPKDEPEAEPAAEEEPADEPKEEPKEEPKDEPKEDEPKDEPKEDEPKDEPKDEPADEPEAEPAAEDEPADEPSDDIDTLKAENEELKKRIAELEKQLSETTNELKNYAVRRSTQNVAVDNKPDFRKYWK